MDKDDAVKRLIKLAKEVLAEDEDGKDPACSAAIDQLCGTIEVLADEINNARMKAGEVVKVCRRVKDDRYRVVHRVLQQLAALYREIDDLSMQCRKL